MKLKHFVTSSILIGALLVCPVSANAYGMDAMNFEQGPIPITVRVDDEYVVSDVDPVIRNNRTLLPLRAAGEALDAKVEWIPRQRAAHLSKDGKEIYFYLNKTTFYVNGEPHKLDSPPITIDNRILIPLRAFGEALGAEVSWDNNLRNVYIDTPRPDAPYPVIPDGVNEDVARFIKKYYVAPSDNDPMVGTWISERQFNLGQEAYPNGPLSEFYYSQYLFFTEYDGAYQCIHVGTETSTIYSGTGIEVDKVKAIRTGDNILYSKADQSSIIYHRVPGNNYSQMCLWLGCDFTLLNDSELQQHLLSLDSYYYDTPLVRTKYSKFI